MFETERKFLVDRAKMPLPSTGEEILQGYIAIDADGTEVRVREKGGRFFMAVKSGEGLVRTEYENEITQEQFDGLWPFTAGRRVEKMRYCVPVAGGYVCELDIFAGSLRGLVMAEVEFRDEKAAAGFTPPEWFADEVTDDSRYKNKNLAVRGLE